MVDMTLDLSILQQTFACSYHLKILPFLDKICLYDKMSVYNLKEIKELKLLWRKRTARISRWLHVYLSMLCFIVVLFFAVTRITLNHAEWFDGKQVENKYTGTVPVNWVNTPNTS
jgi:hypothetical protein